MPMEELLEKLEERIKKVEAGGGEARVAKQREQGKKTARERIELLLDPGSFQELDAFVSHRCTLFGMGEPPPGQARRLLLKQPGYPGRSSAPHQEMPAGKNRSYSPSMRYIQAPRITPNAGWPGPWASTTQRRYVFMRPFSFYDPAPALILQAAHKKPFPATCGQG
ncbi:MAG: carboxyl transferase domain-containing protein [Moorella sp. (in: firmicutes)]